MFRTVMVLCLMAFPASAKDLALKATSLDLDAPANVYVEEVPGVAISKDGAEVYVFNRGRHALLVFGADGSYRREIGAGLFSVPHGLRVDGQGNIWTTDVGNHLVIKFSPAGKVLMVLGKKNTASKGWFHKNYNQSFLNKPSDVAFDSEDNVYVADGGNFRVVKYSSKGEIVQSFGEEGAGDGQFNFPHSLVIDGQNRLLVADRENRRIQLFDLSGVYKGQWDHVGYPYSLALGSDGILWMTDARKDQVVKLSSEGEVLGTFGKPGKASGQYGFLHGIVPVEDGLLVSDILNWKVEHLKFK